jgi:U6 snRNA phosphodiesterase
MALVDYSSSNSTSQESLSEPPAKRRREDVDDEAVTDGNSGSQKPPGVDVAEAKTKTGPEGKDQRKDGHGQADMPPLPPAFHDLYASTVRQSVVDDPSLHQGRKRQTPHVPGNWPSHVYIECKDFPKQALSPTNANMACAGHPDTKQHDLLVQLLGAIEAELGPNIQLNKFLTSDLGAPLPLHISLSRPLTLTTANKDAFLERLDSAIRSHPVSGFSAAPGGLAWYKSPDSERLFLIVRVVTSPSHARSQSGSGSQAPGAPNPELTALLRRCNTVAALFDQPRLYQKNVEDMNVGAAFHVSVAWTFDVPSTQDSLRSLSVFKEVRFKDMPAWEIAVSGVKVKIGNVVHHVPLGGREGRPSWSRKAVDDDDGAFKG